MSPPKYCDILLYLYFPPILELSKRRIWKLKHWKKHWNVQDSQRTCPLSESYVFMSPSIQPLTSPPPRFFSHPQPPRCKDITALHNHSISIKALFLFLACLPLSSSLSSAPTVGAHNIAALPTSLMLTFKFLSLCLPLRLPSLFPLHLIAC